MNKGWYLVLAGLGVVEWGMVHVDKEGKSHLTSLHDFLPLFEDGTFEKSDPATLISPWMEQFRYQLQFFHELLFQLARELGSENWSVFGDMKTLDICCGGGDNLIFTPILPVILGAQGADAYGIDRVPQPEYVRGFYTHYCLDITEITRVHLGDLIGGGGFNMVTFVHTLGRGDTANSLIKTTAQVGIGLWEFQNLLLPQIENLLVPGGIAYVDTMDAWGKIIRK